MYDVRQQQLMHYMQNELQVDFAFIFSPINIYYYTGFLSNPHERFFVLAVDAKQEKTTLFLPTLDEGAAKEVAAVSSYIPVSDTEDAYALFRAQIGEAQAFALEKSVVTVQQLERLLSHYPNATVHNLEMFIQSERLKKTAAEIVHVKRAIEITEEGLANTLPNIKPGMTELQVKAALEYELTMLGADGLAFDTLFLSGEKSALPHGTSGTRILMEGDFLLFDFGVQVNGYCSDLTRTFFLGEGMKLQKNIYEAVRVANEKAIAAVKVGEPLQNIDLAARGEIESRHYGKYFTHRIGHGLGLEVHEAPSIHQENTAKIEPGLLFTIEPGVYVPGVGGVRIEDDVYVNEAGEVEVLSTYPKELITLPV